MVTLAHNVANRSVTLRATSTIVVFSAIVGALFAAVSVPVMQARERSRLEARVTELASTVSSTASIAAFVNDKILAKEVANGLLTNRSIAEVTILTDGKELIHRKRRAAVTAVKGALGPIVRPIASPFDPSQIVGELRIVPAVAEIRSEAAAHARYLGLILALQAAAVAAVVAQVVLSSIVRPIKNISDELHRLQADQGEQLALPEGNERNEIGRLAHDVNALIAKLVDLLSSERQMREQRERGERQLRLIIENAENGIFTIDSAASLVSWNPAFARELRLTSAHREASPPPRLDDLLAPHAEHVRALIAQAMKSAHTVSHDFELVDAANSKRWLNILLQPIEANQLQGLITDVTAHKRAAENALALAEHDHLTGLSNRLGLEHALARLTAEMSEGRHRVLALLMLDLDWFKQVNDTHGHEAGDEVLRAVAGRLRGSVAPKDTVARVGGDEFVLVLNDVGEPETAASIGDRLIASISEPIALANGVRAHVGASIGVAFVRAGIESLEHAMKAADAAMYQAKQAGRSRCVVWGSASPVAIAS